MNRMDKLRKQKVWLVWKNKAEPTSALTGQRKHWQQNLATYSEAREYCRQNDGYRLGIMFNRSCGYFGLDYDSSIRDGNVVGWAAGDYVALRKDGAFIEKSVSGTGFKAIIQCDEPIQRKTILKEGARTGDHVPQVEVFNTKYFALTTDPETIINQDTCKYDKLDIEHWSERLGYDMIRREIEKSDNQEGDVTPERLGIALSKLDIREFRDREGWMRVMSMAHHATGGSQEGLEAFKSWSSDDYALYDEGYTEGQWGSLDSSRANALTFASLINLMSPTAKDDFYKEVSPKAQPEDEFVAIENAVVETAGLADPANQNVLYLEEQFYQKYQDKLVFINELNKWYFYNGVKWMQTDRNLVIGLGQDFVKRENLESMIPRAAVGEIRERANKFINKMLSSATSVQSIGSLAAKDLRYRVGVEDFNNQPFKFNLTNGTFNLETMTLEPHTASDRITQVAGTEYREGAKCDTWLGFLDDVFKGDAELIRFVQQMMGYALLGVNSEEIFPIAYGFGCNGKSTFTKVMQKLFGNYSTTVTSELLASNKAMHPTHVAQLYGNRFALLTEMEGQVELAESMVKQISATDTMTARYMYGNPFEFNPSHLAWLSTNHMPDVRGHDNGIWRRLKLIPFNVDLTSRKDVTMSARLEMELPGIFLWAIEGLKDYHANGFTTSVKVEEATEEYKAEEDDFSAWWESNMTKTEDVMEFVEVNALYAASRFTHGNVRKMCRELRSRGFTTRRLDIRARQKQTVVEGWKMSTNVTAMEF